MISNKTWKRVERVGIGLGILAAISTIIDLLYNKISFVVPTSRFLWRLLNQRIPVFIIIALGLAVFIMIKQIGRKLTEKEVYIISLLDEGERGLVLLFKAYKKTFPAESRTMSSCIIALQRLEKRKLVKSAFLTGGANTIQHEIFKLTEKGLKRYKMLDAVIKEKGKAIFNEVTEQISGREEESRIEPHEEVVFFLRLLASEANRSLAFRDIEPQYQRRFSGRGSVDFQILINILKTNNLIEEVDVGEWEEIGYEILEAGLTYLQKFR